MEIGLTITDPDGIDHDLVVTAEGSHSIADLRDAFAAHLALAPGSYALRTHEHNVLDDALTISAAGLMQADRVLVTAERSPGLTKQTAPGSTRFELNVVGGPIAGRRFPLPIGTVIVGREPACDVRLEDDAASRRHLSLEIGPDRVVATDLESRNGTFVDGRRIRGSHTLTPSEIVEVGSTFLTVAESNRAPSKRPASADGWRSFNRPPRITKPHTIERFTLPEPPTTPRKARFSLGAAVVPVLFGVVMFVVMHQALFLLFSAMGPVMMAWSMVDDRRSGRKEYRAASAQFDVDLETLGERIDEAHQSEIAQRRAAAPAATDLLGRAQLVRPDLWERRRQDADFLSCRVGIADQPTALEIVVPEQGDDDLRSRARQLARQHAIDASVPLVVPLRDVGVLGVAGPIEKRESLARWLVAQATLLQSPRDLGLAILTTAEAVNDWEHAKWLPHTSVVFGATGGGRSIAAQPTDVQSVFEALAEVVTARRAEREHRLGNDAGFSPAILTVITSSDLGISRAALSDVLAYGPDVDVYAIVLADVVSQLPGECRATVELDAELDELAVTFAASGQRIDRAIADGLPLDLAAESARALAPLRDISAGGAGSDLPTELSLLDVLGFPHPTAGSVLQRWATPPPGRRAALGSAGNAPLIIDLRGEGPHALVAGTTGAGKSELLQTLVGSLATTYSPDQMTFILIDYKGGAAFGTCGRLPHTVGFVTDLDPHLAHRALVSLEAELKRRERILARSGAKDLLELEARDPGSAPPSLAIVVDEFATLANEVPDFVAGVVDVAQRGRSLGVHLVLATQRPAGVVTDNIRANTDLRIALRVSDEQDSHDVIDIPDAAHISRRVPGRGLLRSGHGEVKPFQTAYAGAPYRATDQARPIALGEFLFAPEPGRARKRSADTGDETITQLDVLTRAISAAVAQGNVRQPYRPWTDPLPNLLDLASLASVEASTAEAPAPVIGLVDKPQLQTQEPWTARLGANGHLLVYGTAGSGKTTLLRTVAAACATSMQPDEVHIYGIDCASRGLLSIRALPHCGDVVTIEEIERIERLFAMIEDRIAERHELLGRVGAGSLAEYRQRNATDAPPHVVVLLDGYGAFQSTFDNIDHGALLDRLERQVSDGRAVGIHFVIAAERRGAIGMGLAALISDRVVLRLADDDEYAMLGLGNEAKAAVLPAGRGFVDDTMEFQAAVVGAAAPGDAQASALESLGQSLRSTYVDASIPSVGLLPENLQFDELPPPLLGNLQLPLGLDGTRHEPTYLDLSDAPHFLVVGPDRTGRSTALRTIASGWRQAFPDSECYAFIPRRSPLRNDTWTEAALGVDACEALAIRLAESIRTREETDRPILVVIDDGDELGDTRVANALEQVVRRGRDTGVHVVAAAQTHVVHRSYGWLGELKKLKHGLILQPDVDIDGDIFGVRLPRKSVRAFPPGRGYTIHRGTIGLVQVAKT